MQPVNDIAKRLYLETNTVTPLLQRSQDSWRCRHVRPCHHRDLPGTLPDVGRHDSPVEDTVRLILSDNDLSD